MLTIHVSTRAQLDAALKAAKGGETIVLAAGDYGDLATGLDFAQAVTLRSEVPEGARFGKINLSGANNIAFEGMEVTTGFAIENKSSGITVREVDLTGVLYVRSASGVTIEDSRIHDGQFGIMLNSVQGFTVRGNKVFGSAEDLMRVTGDSYGGLIEGNYIHSPRATGSTHPDAIQMFGSSTHTPHDITIRGNHIHALAEDGFKGAQGIFITDARTEQGFRNILVEDNLIQVSMTNAIMVAGGRENVVIRGNTLMPNQGGGSAIIRVGDGSDNSGVTIEGNIAKSIYNPSKQGNIGDNYLYGTGADLIKLFTGTDGSDWSSFLPVKGSPIDFGSGYGADGLLAELAKLALGDASTTGPMEDDVRVVLEHPDVHLSGGGDMVKLAHGARMEIDQGTIQLTFNADTVNGRFGLLAKDSRGSNNLDQVAVFVENGTLKVLIEVKGETDLITFKGIKAGQDYDLALTFDEEKVQLWMDGKMVGMADADLDLSQNHDGLVIGGLNGLSSAGSVSKAYCAFDGAISDFKIYDGVPDHYATDIVPLA